MINKLIRIGFVLLVFCALCCNAGEQSQPVFGKLSCDYEYASSIVVKEKLYFYDSESHRKKLAELTYVVKSGINKIEETPTVALKISEGWLVGYSYLDTYNIQRGALAYLNDRNEPAKLLSEPIEDIYSMPFGYVVIAGGIRTLSPQLRHLDVSFGSLYVVQIKNKIVTIEKLFELNSEPQTSWKSKSGEIIINFQDSSVILNENAFLRNIMCSDYQYQKAQ